MAITVNYLDRVSGKGQYLLDLTVEALPGQIKVLGGNFKAKGVEHLLEETIFLFPDDVSEYKVGLSGMLVLTPTNEIALLVEQGIAGVPSFPYRKLGYTILGLLFALEIPIGATDFDGLTLVVYRISAPPERVRESS